MKHFEGGGCLKGEDHIGGCEWGSPPPKPLTNATTLTNSAPQPLTNVERQMRWRGTNRDKYNAYQAEYMRRHRSEH